MSKEAPQRSRHLSYHKASDEYKTKRGKRAPCNNCGVYVHVDTDGNGNIVDYELNGKTIHICKPEDVKKEKERKKEMYRW